MKFVNEQECEGKIDVSGQKKERENHGLKYNLPTEVATLSGYDVTVIL